jgi:hypothetical protein
MIAVNLAMAIPGFKQKKGAVLRAIFDFIFTIENKKGDILDYWINFYDELNIPPQEFYEAIQKELETRKVPKMELSKESFCEGGMLSEKRIYLRLFRERLAIYACAAPFGKGYFVSCRTVYVPALVRLWHIIFALFLFNVVGALLMKLVGITFAGIAMLTLLFALAAVMRRASASGDSDLDAVLLKIPGISTIYEDWFRADTYFRDDTRTIYLQRIPEVIAETAEEYTAGKGAKLVQQYRFAPVLRELYQTLPRPEKKEK